MIRTYVGDWRLVALRGAIAVLFGVGALLWPELTLWALVVLWGGGPAPRGGAGGAGRRRR